MLKLLIDFPNIIYIFLFYLFLQVQERFEVLKKRKAPEGFTEQGKKLSGLL